MTFQEIATIIIGSGLFAGIISAIVSHYSTSRINSEERKFLLKKEEYFRLQKKAEIIFGYMCKYDKKIKTMFSQLEAHSYSLNEIQKDEEEMNKYKQQIYEILHVYFWDKSQEYNTYSETMSNLMSIYFDVIRNGNMTQDDIDNVEKYEPAFREAQYKFTTAVLDYIKDNRPK